MALDGEKVEELHHQCLCILGGNHTAAQADEKVVGPAVLEGDGGHFVSEKPSNLVLEMVGPSLQKMPQPAEKKYNSVRIHLSEICLLPR